MQTRMRDEREQTGLILAVKLAVRVSRAGAFRLLCVALIATFCLVAGIGNLAKTVTTAGTRVALAASSTPAVYAFIQADCANTGYIYVGGSSVSSSNAPRISACGSVTLPLVIEGRMFYDLADIYIDSSVNGEGVKVLYATRP